MKTENVLKAIGEIAPPELQEAWDNSGPQLLCGKEEINKVLVCLEITQEVIEEAREKQADFVITHHPLIFDPLSSVDDRTAPGAYITQLISMGVSVYSCHTPFDKAAGGNNDYLAGLIGLQDTGGFILDGELEMIGRVGQLAAARTFRQILGLLETALELDRGQMRAVGDLDTMIKTVGVCAGAGADFINAAAENGCQMFLTGDVKYHDAQKARALHLCLVDAGHYGTEKFFSGNFSRQLQEKTGGRLEIFRSQLPPDPFIRL